MRSAPSATRSPTARASSSLHRTFRGPPSAAADGGPRACGGMPRAHPGGRVRAARVGRVGSVPAPELLDPACQRLDHLRGAPGRRPGRPGPHRPAAGPAGAHGRTAAHRCGCAGPGPGRPRRRERAGRPRAQDGRRVGHAGSRSSRASARPAPSCWWVSVRRRPPTCGPPVPPSGRAGKGRAALVTTVGSGAARAAQAAFAEGLALGGYSSPRWVGRRAPSRPSRAGRSRSPSSGSYDEPSVRHAVVRARATMLARNLAVVPSNTKDPAWVAAQARTLAGRGRARREGVVRARAAGRGVRRPAGRRAPPPRRRRGWSSSTTHRPARRPRPRESSWWARESPSTPAASTSSPARACSP